jgi:hypothetical protein
MFWLVDLSLADKTDAGTAPAAVQNKDIVLAHMLFGDASITLYDAKVFSRDWGNQNEALEYCERWA